MNKNIINIVAAVISGIVIGYLLSTTTNLSKTTLNKAKISDVVNNDILQGRAKAEIKSIGEPFYVSEVKMKLQGAEDSLFVSSNGQKFFQKVIDLEEIKKQAKEAKAAKKVSNKTDKPEVELFVMSYCPFGTQAEKGYLPAVQKLGDKVNAKIKFVNYVMHPTQGEGEENLLQYCIQEIAPKKFNSYLGCFLEAGKTDECLSKNAITKASLKTCLDNAEAKFNIADNLKDKSKWLNGRFPKFNIQDDLNKKYGVQGSPTLVINGQKIEGVGRDANSMFKAICSAFKVQPEVCKEELSKEAPSSGFGYDNTGAQNNSQGGCGA